MRSSGSRAKSPDAGSPSVYVARLARERDRPVQSRRGVDRPRAAHHQRGRDLSRQAGEREERRDRHAGKLAFVGNRLALPAQAPDREAPLAERDCGLADGDPPRPGLDRHRREERRREATTVRKRFDRARPAVGAAPAPDEPPGELDAVAARREVHDVAREAAAAFADAAPARSGRRSPRWRRRRGRGGDRLPAKGFRARSASPRDSRRGVRAPAALASSSTAGRSSAPRSVPFTRARPARRGSRSARRGAASEIAAKIAGAAEAALCDQPVRADAERRVDVVHLGLRRGEPAVAVELRVAPAAVAHVEVRVRAPPRLERAGRGDLAAHPRARGSAERRRVEAVELRARVERLRAGEADRALCGKRAAAGRGDEPPPPRTHRPGACPSRSKRTLACARFARTSWAEAVIEAASRPSRRVVRSGRWKARRSRRRTSRSSVARPGAARAVPLALPPAPKPAATAVSATPRLATRTATRGRRPGAARR